MIHGLAFGLVFAWLSVAPSQAAAVPDSCPRAADGTQWRREAYANPRFTLSLCLPPAYARHSANAWHKAPFGGIISVQRQMSIGVADRDRPAVLSPEHELNWKCLAECVQIEGLKETEVAIGPYRAVLETAWGTGGWLGRRASEALLRIGVGADRWIVVRAVEQDSLALDHLSMALRSVRLDRVRVD